jgi:hypothetical protein
LRYKIWAPCKLSDGEKPRAIDVQSILTMDIAEVGVAFNVSIGSPVCADRFVSIARDSTALLLVAQRHRVVPSR